MEFTRNGPSVYMKNGYDNNSPKENFHNTESLTSSANEALILE